jgi:hypothetical protein
MITRKTAFLPLADSEILFFASTRTKQELKKALNYTALPPCCDLSRNLSLSSCDFLTVREA